MEDHAPLIERAFRLEPVEESYDVEEVEGRVPDFVRGTYYLNGPARFSRGEFRYRNWLDGDGMISALRFEAGRVRFTSRFVLSAKLRAEEEAGRPLFRTFGTSFEGDRLKRRVALESPVNVSVYRFGESLLAFGEQGLPWEIDPLTLETRREFNFGGALGDLTPFAAHPKLDSRTGEMFNFGVSFSADPLLNLYRFDASARLIYRQRIPLEYACSVHDFAISRNHVVLYLSPYVLDTGALVGGGRTLCESLGWQPERGSRLLVASRETGKPVASVAVGSRYCLHLINCFEEDARLTVDVLELERPVYGEYRLPEIFADVGEGLPVRFVIDLESGELVERRELGYRLAPDFPSINPSLSAQAYEEFWMLGISAAGKKGRKFFDQLVHARWAHADAHEIYQAPANHYLCGEPVFVADPTHGSGGAVVCQLFDAGSTTSAFLIFDAADVARGPVSTLRLRHPIRLGFHATFCTGDAA
ncbi:MAG: carotenoid oxygenase family protein [Acidobacteria bacterium]|nr:carotenoid oxygenase family protein [Acidobacteriota bacterium]